MSDTASDNTAPNNSAPHDGLPGAFVRAQSLAAEPEAFQTGLIRGLTRALARTPAPPCLLHAPTGSGKTFVLARVLENVSQTTPTLWLWFVPFVNLVQQTEDALIANCPGLTTARLMDGRNGEARAGTVLLATAQSVARASERRAGYAADADDTRRSLADFVARARAQGLRVGMVVDEAHIGLDKTTEFGQFAHWLAADFLLLATATPKDARLTEFLKLAGMSAYESFAASRDDVVEARLNKRYIEAVVYDLRQSAQTVTDLQRTVLRQAWKRSQRLKRELADAGVALTPLLLVQVANGEGTVEAARDDLMTLCGVHPAAIGMHSSEAPDPVLMAAIANDASKEVLIFKQSAGTGFDAPRAFVLASTKPVNDNDFAMQFIGRVMRVARAVREAWPRPTPIPEDLDTAYVYLADATAQRGFAAAVAATQAVRTQLEGQTERLEARQMASGALVYTNRPTPQTPLIYDAPIPLEERAPELKTQSPVGAPGTQAMLFDKAAEPGRADAGLDEIRPQAPRARLPDTPRTQDELDARLTACGIQRYPRRAGLRNLPAALRRESRPLHDNMSAVSETAASRLDITESLQANAVRAATNRLREKEIHTELTHGESHEIDVLVVTDRNALAREARRILLALPQAEEADARCIVEVLARRLRPAIDEAFDDAESRPIEAALQRLARDAAHWVVRREAVPLAELMQGLIADAALLEDAAPLPDAMLFPAALALAPSKKNVYGALPPSEDDLAQIESTLLREERDWLADRTLRLAEGELRLARFDGACKLNGEERAFAQALDRADFVEWWHRNPDRKDWAVRLVRGEHRNYFYPDFVVCLAHVPGDEPLLRLIETKQDVKDAARKALREPRYYGRVLFLTRDQNRLRVVNENGSLGETVDYDDLGRVQAWFRTTKPLG